MPEFFFDTSALAKRYISERGSAWVTKACALASGNFIYIAEITAVEIASAITRRTRSGSLSFALAQAALARFEADLANEYFVLQVTSASLTEARSFAQTYGLRGYDAVQLAIAANLNRLQLAAALPPVTFVSADDELLVAAKGEGLPIENPNYHP